MVGFEDWYWEMTQIKSLVYADFWLIIK